MNFWIRKVLSSMRAMQARTPSKYSEEDEEATQQYGEGHFVSERQDYVQEEQDTGNDHETTETDD